MIVNGKFIFDDRSKEVYIEHIEKNGLPATAAKAIGTSSRRVTSERTKDEQFDEACNEADMLFREAVEMEIRRRAMDGVQEPVFYQGCATGETITKYSDSLLQFMGKAKLPEYGDKLKVEQHVTGGVLLCAAPAMSTQNWLDSVEPKKLPAATSDEDKDIVDAEVVSEAVSV